VPRGPARSSPPTRCATPAPNSKPPAPHAHPTAKRYSPPTSTSSPSPTRSPSSARADAGSQSPPVHADGPECTSTTRTASERSASRPAHRQLVS
jgi:hypothetical protein